MATIILNPSRAALCILTHMAPVDMYDYLWTYGTSPHGQNLNATELRIEVLLDIQETGPLIFCRRMVQDDGDLEYFGPTVAQHVTVLRD